MAVIVAFEGIDGTGKGTQMERAAGRLAAAGLSVARLSFPVYESFFGGEVGKLLTGSEGVRADAVDRKSMALWFALDRFEALRGFDPACCDVLLINRYVLSNAVYQSIRDCDAGRPDLLDFVLTLEHEHFGLPRPDAYLLFDMDLAQAAGNVDKKGYRGYVGQGRDIYESIPAIQRRAREKYLAYAARLPNVRVIPCMRGGRLESIETIGARVDAALAEMGLPAAGKEDA